MMDIGKTANSFQHSNVLLLFSRWFQFLVLISSLTEELFLRKFSHIQHVCCCVVLAWWGFISILLISTCIVVRK